MSKNQNQLRKKKIAFCFFNIILQIENYEEIKNKRKKHTQKKEQYS